MMFSNIVQVEYVQSEGVKFKTQTTFELLIIYSQKSIQHTPSQHTPSFKFHPIMINTILGKKNHL